MPPVKKRSTHPPRITGTARTQLAAELRRRYDSGATQRQLVEEFGLSRGLVFRLLGEAGTKARGPASREERKKRLTGMARKMVADDLKAKYDSGASLRELAKWSGRPKATVRYLLGEVNTKMRSPHSNLRVKKAFAAKMTVPAGGKANG
ncbi:helix-turn-helix domain-containing protein [Streptomyces sp. SID1121]|uniref:helix-turn-helix domain-containing protein n=1 Tax=Streptomyces sp. SID1121 TaxID=3425888 RepID=UPI004057AD08